MTAILGATSTTDDVLEDVDLSGKRFLVTGVSSGLGVETARSLVARGATVIGAARDLDKARAATSHIQGALELVELDLASLASVRACADRLLADGRPFDAIIANAGVMACPQGKTADGFETQFGTNHVGHFVLINRLVPLLKPGARVVMLASAAHGFSDIDLDDPNFERTTYHELLGYGRSKTANILFAVEFDRRYRDKGVRAAAVHPGAIRTELNRHITPEVRERLSSQPAGQQSEPAPAIEWKTVPQGAATSVWAACVAAPDDIGARYCADCQVSAATDERSYVGNSVQSYAVDPDRAAALWTVTETMVQKALASRS